MKRTFSIVAAVLLGAATQVNADSLVLSDSQMDQVSAGALGLAGALAQSVTAGDLLSDTYSETAAVVDLASVLYATPTAASATLTFGTATSLGLGAVSTSTASSLAQLLN